MANIPVMWRRVEMAFVGFLHTPCGGACFRTHSDGGADIDRPDAPPGTKTVSVMETSSRGVLRSVNLNAAVSHQDSTQVSETLHYSVVC